MKRLLSIKSAGFFSNSSLCGSWGGGISYLAAKRALFISLLFLITLILGLPHLGSVMQDRLSDSLEEHWKGQRLDAINISA